MPDNMDIEELELMLIDGGLEEIEENEGTSYTSDDFTNFDSLSQAFEDFKIEVLKANLKRLPNAPAKFSEEQLNDIEKLIDKLEDNVDVQAVYTNIA